ncbi:hypothetical protein [Candidatus Venteria ishoeyi]|uniref:Uncharacterized protein n=1 Tax=Candidatus Venteria ishoeyi TaxID=1899563 RepID=A0A1H6FBN6_9GAMM|nr:hypothetical protein [Candidatus Venteria ishoeyi]MDM8545978.1 hypothetical protein [Candidatus Venteria ishoeyi]SEH06811.1 Uncharacterised protein [Candidatus Venteria ishoeyi]
MNQQQHGAQDFFYELLANQTVENDCQQISDTRMYAILTKNRQFTPQEQQALLDSPCTQARFTLLADVVKMEQHEQQAAWPPIEALAAAEKSIHKLEFEVSDYYHLTLFPIDAKGTDWEILLTIAPKQRAMFQAGIQLLDEQGLVWLQGQLDAQGQISGFWEQEVNLWDYIHDHTLRIQAL